MSAWTVTWLIALLFGAAGTGAAFVVSSRRVPAPAWLREVAADAGGPFVLVVIVSLPALVWSVAGMAAASLMAGIVGAAMIWWGSQQEGAPSTGDGGMFRSLIGGIYLCLAVVGLIVDAALRLYGG